MPKDKPSKPVSKLPSANKTQHVRNSVTGRYVIPKPNRTQTIRKGI